MWAEAAAANEALEALEDAKRLAARRLAAARRPDSGGSHGSHARVIELKGGCVYVGETSADGRTPHGQGALLLDDGAQHVGAFAHGRAHGRGTWQDAAGRVAHGEWRENKRARDFECLDADGARWAETYAEAGGARLSRERLGTSAPARRCACCAALYHEHANHAYACRTHRAAYASESEAAGEGAADAGSGGGDGGLGAGGAAPGSTYRRLISPAELARRAEPGGGAPRPTKPPPPAAAEDGIWPCCGKRSRADRGCVLNRHRPASRERRGGAPAARR